MYNPHHSQGYPGYTSNAEYQYNNNSQESYPSQGGGYPHHSHSQSSYQDGQDAQGDIPLMYPYLSSNGYQHPGLMQQGTSAQHQDFYMQQQQYEGGGNDHDQQFTGRAQRHEFEEVGTTPVRDIEPYIRERMEQGQKKFVCGYPGCTHSGKFVRKAQLQTHIKSVHLSEKPFKCTTCDASFTRRQDAARHVDTMNSGRQFKCHFCDDGFARRDYRDRHCERCSCRNNRYR